MPQAILSKIMIDDRRQEQVIVLHEKDGPRQFPIVISIFEALSIKSHLAGTPPPRPMTHDLLANVIKDLGAQVEQVIVDDLKGNTFHAKLVMRTKDNQQMRIDCRPSDAIALAVRTRAAVFVEEEVFKKATTFKVE